MSHDTTEFDEFFGYRQDSRENEISFTLIVAGAPLTCTSIPDHGPHPDDGPSGQS